ncbi:protein tyrosine phosphatase domain-containing protein 1-like [Glandiceps talaboti]
MLTASYAVSQVQKSLSQFATDHAMANTPRGEIKWTTGAGSHIGSTEKPTAKYSALSDGLRQITPETWQCSMFCGGKNCKYCNAWKANWPKDRMVIDGLFSEWVTDDILAMSRPSTEAIDKYNIIDQFKRCGIKSIINLQRPGEHTSCGNPLEEESGFSYLPQTFMDNDIFFYNFGWDDYGVRSLPSILDMVKVMSFALQEGKAAVHCHAGLGRTGVLIACYLIYAKRMEADQVIHFIREKRGGAIQTRGQIECCQQFGKFLIPLRVVFSSIDPCAYAFTLKQFLIRQKHLLHGYEARELKYIPKIVHIVCKRIVELANCNHGSFIREYPIPHDKKLALEMATAANAFPEKRNKQRSTFDVIEDNPVVNKGGALRLPPIRKAKSAESLVPDSDMNGDGEGDPSNMNLPKPKPLPRSPNLRLRSRELENDFKGNSVSSGSDDDLMLTTRSDTFAIQGHRIKHEHELHSQFSRESIMSTAMSIDAGVVSGKNKRPVKGRFSRGPLPRRSSILSQVSETLSEEEENQDVYIVARAMAFTINKEVDQHERARVDALQALKQRLESLQHDINVSSATWNILSTEEDPYVLCSFMYSWLEQLKEPVLCVQDIVNLMEHIDDPKAAVKLLDKAERHTLECMLMAVAKLHPLSKDLEQPILGRILKALTGHSKGSGDKPSSKQDRYFGIEFLEAYVDVLREKIQAGDDSISLDSQSVTADEMSRASTPRLHLAQTVSNVGPTAKSLSDPTMPVPNKKNNTLPPIK